MAHLVLLLNGITDLELRDLKGRTPLEASKHVHLDNFLKSGTPLKLSTSLQSSYEKNLLTLIGASENICASQSIFEAIALGHPFKNMEAAISCRFVSMGKDVITDTSNDLLTDREGELFCNALNRVVKHLNCHFYHLEGPRALLISSHPAIAATLPFNPISPVSTIGRLAFNALPKVSQEYKGTLEEIIALFQTTLESSEINTLKADFEEPPVNGIIFTEGGQWTENLSKATKLSKDSLIISPTPSTLGIAKYFSIDAWSLPRESSKFANISLVLHYLEQILNERGVIIWEIPYLWNSTYNGNLLEKIKSIEFLDKHLLSPLKPLIDLQTSKLSIFPLANTSIQLGQLQEGPVPGIHYPSQDLTETTFNENILNSSHVNSMSIGDILEKFSDLAHKPAF